MESIKQLLVTYDYELFLGNRSGTVGDCMIDPTNKLISVMEPYGIKAVFFVDTTYLLRLKEKSMSVLKCRDDFDSVARQLRELVRHGHYVFPHIHPHWLDAEYNESTNQWQLNNIAKYRFYNCSDSEKEQVFDGSVSILREILMQEFPDYRITGYRAGGWCIQPFIDFVPFFKKHNIEFEFSVLTGFYQFSEAQFFDFSDSPLKNIYRFTEDICREVENGEFTQFTISSLQTSALTDFLNRLWLKVVYKIFKDHTFTRGEGQMPADLSHQIPGSGKGRDINRSDWERVAVELLTAVKAGQYKKYFMENTYMHFISHPKMINNHNLSEFDKFLQFAFKNYRVETDFMKMIP
jgi:hypothetical protein